MGLRLSCWLLLGCSHRAWNRVRVFINIEALVDLLGDGLNFNAQILFDVVQVEAVIPANQVDGQTKVAVAT